jgi:hypothetical protein
VRPAQHREGGVGAQPSRITAGGDQQRLGRVGPDPKPRQQVRGGCGGEAVQLSVQGPDLSGQAW